MFPRISELGCGILIAIQHCVNDAMDRKTAAFYLTLVGLVVLDMILLVWMFTPVGRYGAASTPVVYAAETPTVIAAKLNRNEERPKPSSFDYFAKRAAR